MELGKCFICNEVCDAEAYCHFECALSYADFKVKQIRKKIEDEKAGKKVKWKEQI